MERDRHGDREGQKSKGNTERPDKHLVKEENYGEVEGVGVMRTKVGGKVAVEKGSLSALFLTLFVCHVALLLRSVQQISFLTFWTLLAVGQ